MPSVGGEWRCVRSHETPTTHHTQNFKNPVSKTQRNYKLLHSPRHCLTTGVFPTALGRSICTVRLRHPELPLRPSPSPPHPGLTNLVSSQQTIPAQSLLPPTPTQHSASTMLGPAPTLYCLVLHALNSSRSHPTSPFEPSPCMDGSSSRNLSRVVAVCTCRHQPRSSCSAAAPLPR